jgi:hypothetical protein
MMKLRATLAAVAAFGSIANAGATNYTWTGPQNGQWSNPAHWTPLGVPGTGDTLQFPCPTDPEVAPLATVNDLAAGTVILAIAASGECVINGNEIVTTSIRGLRTTVNAPVRLSGNGSIEVLDLGAGLDVGPFALSLQTGSIAGVIAGQGYITSSFGGLDITGTHTFTGTLETLANGEAGSSLAIDGVFPGSVKTGTMFAKGVVGGLDATTLELRGALAAGPVSLTSRLLTNYGLILTVGGAFTLGPEAELLLTGATRVKRGQVFTIVAHAGTGPVAARFANAPEGHAVTGLSAPMRVSYLGGDGNDITVTALRGSFVLSDYEADGSSDLMWHNDSTGVLYRMSMDGAVITSRDAIYQEPNTAWRVVGDGDFNGDGAADLLWRNEVSGDVYLMTMSEGRPAGGGYVYREANPNWRIVSTRDLDDDARADILWWNVATGETYVLLMQGTAIKSQGYVPTQLGPEWKFATASKMEGAGPISHLVWRHAQNGQALVTRTNFGGAERNTTDSLLHVEPDPAWRIVGAGAVNAGFPEDIFWFNDQTAELYVMIAPGPSRVSFGAGAVVHRATPGWKPAAIADYDGDGKSDVAWRNVVDGRVHIMLLDGLAVKGGQTVHVEPDPSWRLLGSAEYLAE